MLHRMKRMGWLISAMLMVALVGLVVSPEALAAPRRPEPLRECTPEAQSVEQAWRLREPARPSAIAMGRSSVTIARHIREVQALQSDKAQHCAMGCFLAAEVDVPTALYLGWLKEDRDLRDCNPGTHFEPLDELATRDGAFFAASLGNGRTCLNLCRDHARRPNR